MSTELPTTFPKHICPFAATLTVLADLLRPRKDIDPVDSSLQLDGTHFLITGASKGLDRAVAQDIAKRAANLTLVAPRFPEDLKSDLERLAALQVIVGNCDLSDLERVAELSRNLSEHPAVLGEQSDPAQ